MVTSLYAAILAIMFIILSVMVIKQRRKYKIAIGDKAAEGLQRFNRAHGNFVEYTPFFLIMLAMAEFNNLNLYAVHLIAIIFIIGRISHAYGLTVAENVGNDRKANYKFRVFGMMCSFSCLGLLSVGLFIQYIAEHTAPFR